MTHAKSGWWMSLLYRCCTIVPFKSCPPEDPHFWEKGVFYNRGALALQMICAVHCAYAYNNLIDPQHPNAFSRPSTMHQSKPTRMHSCTIQGLLGWAARLFWDDLFQNVKAVDLGFPSEVGYWTWKTQRGRTSCSKLLPGCSVCDDDILLFQGDSRDYSPCRQDVKCHNIWMRCINLVGGAMGLAWSSMV